MLELTGILGDNLNKLSFKGTLRPQKILQPLAALHVNGKVVID